MLYFYLQLNALNVLNEFIIFEFLDIIYHTQRQVVTAMTQVLNKQETHQTKKSQDQNRLPSEIERVSLRTVKKDLDGESQIFRKLAKTLLESLQSRNAAQEYLQIVQQNILFETIRDEIVQKRYLPDSNIANSIRNLGSQGHLKSNNQVSVKSIKVQNMVTGEMKSSRNSTYENNKSISENWILVNQEDIPELQTSLIGSKSKFAQQMESSILQIALQEVKQLCSQQNYEIIRTACQSNKAHQYLKLKINYQKLKKQNQQILAASMTLHKEKSNLLWEINLMKPKMKAIEDQKLKMKKQADQLRDKQDKLFKVEASFAFKEKINMQGRKRYQRQHQSANNSLRKLQQANRQFIKLWDAINDKCSASECQNGCWKKDVMKKCKDKIMEQRNMLIAQQQQMQKEYQIMSNLSGQFKKLFSKEDLAKQG